MAIAQLILPAVPHQSASPFEIESANILLRVLCERVGARFVGIQKGDASLGLEPLLLADGVFGNTFAISIFNCTQEAIERALLLSNSQFALCKLKRVVDRLYEEFHQIDHSRSDKTVWSKDAISDARILLAAVDSVRHAKSAIRREIQLPNGAFEVQGVRHD